MTITVAPVWLVTGCSTGIGREIALAAQWVWGECAAARARAPPTAHPPPPQCFLREEGQQQQEDRGEGARARHCEREGGERDQEGRALQRCPPSFSA